MGMEQIEIWQRFNRINRVCNQLAMCDEAGGEAIFSSTDEALSVGDDADFLLAYVRSANDTDFMLNCCKIDRNRLNGRSARAEIRNALFSCWSSLNEIHDLALKVVFGISNEDIKDCKYYINCVDGLCKDSETSSTIINPVEKEVNDLPSELNTDEALRYFAKAKEIGLIDDGYKWLKGKQLLSCFCHDMSKKLALGKGDRIAWKPFEILFGIETGRLRSNYNDIKKTGQNPSDIALVEQVFE